ncbi:hypothetical protein GUJ93_ZPchr0004g39697 [Zizania palustris]|uniref:Uncharacterized protein n=1 Tax=Zizania palustris TaxID=103762 RepID=A0A8J5VFI0_ZIZPA|nr:hypothetical protein GUJ93_ZPchr0004g39697 [Zizania palustris]
MSPPVPHSTASSRSPNPRLALPARASSPRCSPPLFFLCPPPPPEAKRRGASGATVRPTTLRSGKPPPLLLLHQALSPGVDDLPRTDASIGGLPSCRLRLQHRNFPQRHRWATTWCTAVPGRPTTSLTKKNRKCGAAGDPDKQATVSASPELRCRKDQRMPGFGYCTNRAFIASPYSADRQFVLTHFDSGQLLIKI